jgi:CheY-like chemotaxis protein
LERCNHAVQTASTYSQAMELAGRHTFDLLISDVGLPDRSGLELMQELNCRCGIRGIALSGYTEEADAAASEGAGFTRHLNKPVVFNELISAIDEVVGVRPPRQAGTPLGGWNAPS